MKKMINALLAASMLASFAAVPFTTNAAVTSSPVIQSNERSYEVAKITNLDTIRNMINDFIKENKIGLKVVAKEKISEKYSNNYVFLRWDTQNAADDDIFCEFLYESNIDDKLIQFIPFDPDDEETELNRISALLKDNNINATVLGADTDYIENKVTVEYYWKNEDIPAIIRAYLAGNSIDTDLVSFAIDEGAAIEKITDLDIIGKILSDYIKNNNIPAYVIGVNSNYAENKVTVQYNWVDKDIPDKIKAYLVESNIDTDLVSFAIDENTSITKGDANCDGQVDMADAVLIMQALANPNKYGLDGTAEVHLTEQGKANADMEGDGLTVGDAQAIQKILLGLE